MPTVTFTRNLARHVDCPRAEAPGATVAEVLDAIFAENPRLRGYVVDEHGCLRKHMVVFLDGTAVRDRAALSDPIPDASSQIFVMQALSGG
ncbi:MAG: MoaD/ThiS family protein [Ectothiorhodospiraceae bacterium]|nr:MoaD/ThiS family protein [Ectothiorhodospiraceae bacterium]